MGHWVKISGAGRLWSSCIGSRLFKFTSFAVSAWLLLTMTCTAADSATLWEIGKPDGDNREFAHAPAGYGQIREDAVFFIGESDPARDWPYAQPGPADNWAGSRRHTFLIAGGRVHGGRHPPVGLGDEIPAFYVVADLHDRLRRLARVLEERQHHLSGEGEPPDLETRSQLLLLRRVDDVTNRRVSEHPVLS